MVIFIWKNFFQVLCIWFVTVFSAIFSIYNDLIVFGAISEFSLVNSGFFVHWLQFGARCSHNCSYCYARAVTQMRCINAIISQFYFIFMLERVGTQLSKPQVHHREDWVLRFKMSSTKLPGYDDTVICPYNKCHVILKHRFQTHLVKCERSNSHIKLETCPFDATHRFRAEDKTVSIVFLCGHFVFSELK